MAAWETKVFVNYFIMLLSGCGLPLNLYGNAVEVSFTVSKYLFLVSSHSVNMMSGVPPPQHFLYNLPIKEMSNTMNVYGCFFNIACGFQ